MDAPASMAGTACLSLYLLISSVST